MSPSFPTSESLKSCYFFYGEEAFISQQFIQDVTDVLFPGNEGDRQIERFKLDEKGWGEIIDVARTVPFFTSRRLVVVEAANSMAKLTSLEEKILAEYFETCSSQTVMIVVCAGRVKKNAPLVRFFSSLPGASVSIEEMKPLKEGALLSWADRRFRALHKIPAQDALRRLVELTGKNLARINAEIEKIALFTGEVQRVSLDDVNLVSGWVKSFYEWEIGENLEKGDYQQCLLVLDKLLNQEGTKPEFIVGHCSRFFSNMLLAKLYLVEKTMDKKSVFRELKPQIQEKFGDFYKRKFNEFFDLVEGFSLADLNRFIGLLEDVDFKTKTSGAPPQVLLEGFFFEYCRWRNKKKTILSKGR